MIIKSFYLNIPESSRRGSGGAEELYKAVHNFSDSVVYIGIKELFKLQTVKLFQDLCA